MSNASIGSGTADDSNENHPGDSLPSKTLGAEAGGKNAAAAANPAEPAASQTLHFDADASDLAGADRLAKPDQAPQSSPSIGNPVQPEACADGPNIVASPQELEATRRNSRPV